MPAAGGQAVLRPPEGPAGRLLPHSFIHSFAPSLISGRACNCPHSSESTLCDPSPATRTPGGSPRALGLPRMVALPLPTLGTVESRSCLLFPGCWEPGLQAGLGC